VYFGYTCEFQREREILDIQTAWQSLGPYEWRALDKEEYGVKIVARGAGTELENTGFGLSAKLFDGYGFQCRSRAV